MYFIEECKKIVKIFDIVEPVAAAMNEHKDNFYVYVSGVGVMSSLACIGKRITLLISFHYLKI